MNCKQCSYYWQDSDDDFPQCHFNSLGIWDTAPCEIGHDVCNECERDCTMCGVRIEIEDV